MGMGDWDVRVLIKLKEDGHLDHCQSVIEIGAQQCTNKLIRDTKLLKKLAFLYEIDSLPPLGNCTESNFDHGMELLHNDAPPSSIFWKWLGFKYKSIDVNESHESFFIDLNYDDIPDEEYGQYDLLTNFGTTEHVINQLNAFKVMHDLTAPKGLMFHCLPFQGHQIHGFFNYSPKFFWKLAAANRYEWVYFDCSKMEMFQELNPDVANHIYHFYKDIEKESKEYKIADAALRVVFKKTTNAPFVPPLDINPGDKIDNPTIKKRYWSFF